MSGLTTEYMVRKSDNSIRYDVIINSFHKKIKTFNNGREIHSRVFKIGQSKFQIEIYPNGDAKKDKGNVGIFLRNKSDWRLKLKATFHVARGPARNDNHLERWYDSGEGYGWPTFLDHKSCAYENLDEGTFEIQVTITVLAEEVTAQRDMTGLNEGTKEALDSQTARLSSEVDVVKEEVDDMKEEVHVLMTDMRDVKEELHAAKRQQDLNFSALQRGIEELKLSMQGITVSAVQSTRQFECPMCTEEAKYPMRLKQCGEGHIICDTCYARDEQARQREGRERNQCGVCRGPITGRPTALETFLGLS